MRLLNAGGPETGAKQPKYHFSKETLVFGRISSFGVFKNEGYSVDSRFLTDSDHLTGELGSPLATVAVGTLFNW